MTNTATKTYYMTREDRRSCQRDLAKELSKGKMHVQMWVDGNRIRHTCTPRGEWVRSAAWTEFHDAFWIVFDRYFEDLEGATNYAWCRATDTGRYTDNLVFWRMAGYTIEKMFKAAGITVKIVG